MAEKSIAYGVMYQRLWLGFSPCPLLAAALLGGCVGDLGDVSSSGGSSQNAAGGGGSSANCVDQREFFALEVWPTLSAQCMSCHAPGGEAATGDNAKMKTAGFTLEWESTPDFLNVNMKQLERMVIEQVAGKPKLLIKPIGADDHGGGVILDADGPEYASLKKFAASADQKAEPCATASSFPDVTLHDFSQTFRRAALTLGGRLPTSAEALLKDEKAFDSALEALMDEEGFVGRVKMAFNDVLLFEAGNQVAVNCASQLPAAIWPEVTDCGIAPEVFCAGKNEPELSKCKSAFTAWKSNVHLALTQEPLEIIANVVRKKAPFTEVLTADYTMVNPYSAGPYGIAGDFAAPTVPGFGDWKEKQLQTARGPYPHAGVLSTPGFLGRWVSTPTNRDRARARLVYKAFLGLDVLNLAQRPVDTSALTAVANAPRNAAACSSCHSVLDPVANAFSNYTDTASLDFDPEMSAATNRHQEMLPPGFNGETIPGDERRMLPWLAQAVGQDPRFALAVTRTLFEAITGVSVQPFPRTENQDELRARFQAWDVLDRFLHEVAEDFQKQNYDVRAIARAIVKSAYFRASALPDGLNPELARSLGNGRLLTPEMLADKIRTTLGTHWGQWAGPSTPRELLLNENEIFYGGIDSLSVTERLKSPTVVSMAVASRMAHEMPCRVVAWDFTRAPPDRALFPEVELSDQPASSESAIRKNIAYLIQRLHGVNEDPDGVEVSATYDLFTATHAELAAEGSNTLMAICQGKWDRSRAEGEGCESGCATCCKEPLLPENDWIVADDDFTIRSWSAVLTYLLSDYRFLHQ